MCRGGKTASLCQEEAVCRDTKRGVMVEPSPAPAFVVPESEFLLQFLVVLFDDPALFGKRHQLLQLCTGRQSGKPVLRRLCFPLWPFDKQPFLRMLSGVNYFYRSTTTILPY